MIAARFILRAGSGVRLCTLEIQLEDLYAVGAGRDIRAAMDHVTRIIPEGYELSSSARQTLGGGLKKLLETREDVAVSLTLERGPGGVARRHSTGGAGPEDGEGLLRELARCRERCEERDRRLKACVERQSHLESQLAVCREAQQDRLQEIQDLSVSNSQLKRELEEKSGRLVQVRDERDRYRQECLEKSERIKDLAERLKRYDERDAHSDTRPGPSDPFY